MQSAFLLGLLQAVRKKSRSQLAIRISPYIHSYFHLNTSADCFWIVIPLRRCLATVGDWIIANWYAISVASLEQKLCHVDLPVQWALSALLCGGVLVCSSPRRVSIADWTSSGPRRMFRRKKWNTGKRARNRGPRPNSVRVVSPRDTR